ncbi:hypothetical protein [Paraburkholderia sp. RCC_158]|uniref:hypothetical protein n=1 Tax=Paraburkholderia sp. RCC_158 TaxID=3239220 RepID=UPI0035241387
MSADKTYTYDEITAVAKQIVTDELARAQKEPDAGPAGNLRGYAAGAWLLWQTVTRDEVNDDQRREDAGVFKKLLGL